MAETVIAIRDLRVRYGETEAVKGVTLEIARGEVVGLIGPDGAGKTSTLRVLAGLQRASAGSVVVLGRDAWKHRRALHHVLGYLAQRFALYGDLTVDENVEFFALLLGVPEWRARRNLLLERVGLTPFRGRLADRLSGGMRQKLALACSLMHAPEVLLLDEPTTGVDPVTRREFWRLLADLVADGLTLIIATPYLDEAERCSRVVLIHEGGVLADAPPTSLSALLPGAVFEVAGEPRAKVPDVLRRVPGVLEVRPFAARFHVRLESATGAAERLRAALASSGITVEEIGQIPAGLEDTFLHLTRTQRPSQPEAA
jgi:ABC-2 type transport system ATP-binding protein